MKRSKRYNDAASSFDRTAPHSPADAVSKCKELAKAKFDETIELAIKLGTDPRKADQMVRGTVVLPHGTGKTIKILAFAKGDKAREAEEAGADYVGADELVDKIKSGWTDFDAAVATPDVMGSVGKIGKILGPRGLMPNPKAGTVTFDIGKAVGDIKKGKVEYRNDRQANIHIPIGKASFSEKSLMENYLAVIDEVMRAKPSAAKGKYIKSITISSTMGPGISVDPAPVRSLLAESET